MTPSRSEDQLSFRPMAQGDLGLLQQWLNEPHVAQWWDDGQETSAAVEAKYADRVAGEHHVVPWIVEVEAQAVGWVQWYRVADEAEWFPGVDIPPDVVALDVAIGDPAYTGRGLGKKVVLEFMHHVLRPAAPNSTQVWIDPDSTNARAIATYKAVGFVDTDIDLPNPTKPTAARRLMTFAWAGPAFR